LERGDFGRYVGYMPQATTLFEGSVADNVARLRDAELGEVIAVCRRLESMTPSCGCRRATPPPSAKPASSCPAAATAAGTRTRTFGQPKLLVLDEPNSNLDEEGENALLAAIAAARHAGSSS